MLRVTQKQISLLLDKPFKVSLRQFEAQKLLGLLQRLFELVLLKLAPLTSKYALHSFDSA